MTLPNFFLLGAPKCGTTALFTYLGTHPQVYFPADKEPHFFAEDFPSHRTCKTLDDYERLYASVKSQSIVGDASVLSLYSETALSKMLTSCPEAKFLVAVRNPVDLVVSLHRQYVLSGRDHELDFERAWNREFNTERQTGLLHYPQYGRFTLYLGKLFEAVEENRIHTVFLEDLQTEPLRVYLELLKFLELPDDLRRDFPKINEGRKLKHPRISQFVVSQSWLVSLLKKMRITKLLRRWGSVPADRTPITTDLRHQIEYYFYQDILWLAEKYDRDLSHWFSLNFEKKYFELNSSDLKSQNGPHTVK